MKEVWRDIKGYKGLYQASNLGRIKSISRSIIRSDGRKQSFKERILKPGIAPNGYFYVALSNQINGPISYCVHRLVIESFISNINNKIDVNHIDSNKQNNSLTNLEYATRSENMKHAYNTGRLISSNKGNLGFKSKLYKKVFQYDLQGNLINEYYGTSEASRITGICQSCISLVCQGKQYQSGNFIWKYLSKL